MGFFECSLPDFLIAQYQTNLIMQGIIDEALKTNGNMRIVLKYEFIFIMN